MPLRRERLAFDDNQRQVAYHLRSAIRAVISAHDHSINKDQKNPTGVKLDNDLRDALRSFQKAFSSSEEPTAVIMPEKFKVPDPDAPGFDPEYDSDESADSGDAPPDIPGLLDLNHLSKALSGI